MIWRVEKYGQNVVEALAEAAGAGCSTALQDSLRVQQLLRHEVIKVALPRRMSD